MSMILLFFTELTHVHRDPLLRASLGFSLWLRSASWKDSNRTMALANLVNFALFVSVRFFIIFSKYL